jgi:xylan 1,4-beta-xylosidase
MESTASFPMSGGAGGEYDPVKEGISMAVRVPEIDYYSLHGIWGAYGSLVLGRLGRGAGVVVGGVRPPRGGLFVGYRVGRGEPRLLPFSAGIGSDLGASAYREDEVDDSRSDALRSAAYFSGEEIERLLSFSGEEWRAGALSFRVISFFGEVPDPKEASPAAAREGLRPSLLLSIGLDNSEGAGPMTGLFGMQGIRRPLSDSTAGGLLGMADGSSYGFAIRPRAGVAEVMDWSVVDAAFDGGRDGAARPLRRLASEGGLRFSLAPGEKAEYIVALGLFRDGIVTSGMGAHAYHSCLFKDLEDVLESALDSAPESLARAGRMDELLEGSGLSDDRKFLLSHAAHSYCANTELLL